MEFENPTSAPATITDEQRRMAQAKKVVINPVDPFIKPEDAPDPVVVNETHSNIGKDAEDTSESTNLLQPSAGSLRQMSTKHHVGRTALIIVLCVVLGIAAGAALFLGTR